MSYYELDIGRGTHYMAELVGRDNVKTMVVCGSPGAPDIQALGDKPEDLELWEVEDIGADPVFVRRLVTMDKGGAIKLFSSGGIRIYKDGELLYTINMLSPCPHCGQPHVGG